MITPTNRHLVRDLTERLHWLVLWPLLMWGGFHLAEWVVHSSDPHPEHVPSFWSCLLVGVPLGAVWITLTVRRTRAVREMTRLVREERLEPRVMPYEEVSDVGTRRLARALRRRHSKASGLWATAQSQIAQLNHLLDLLGEAIIIVDRLDRVVYSNAVVADFFDLEAGHVLETIGEILRDRNFRTQFETARETKRAVMIAMERPEDSRILHVRLEPFTSWVPEPGTPRDARKTEPGVKGVRTEFMAIIVRDVSRQERLERNRREFVSNVSHELRTPLAAIAGYVETLRDGGMESPELAERFLGVIERHTVRLQALVNDILELAHLDEPVQRNATPEELDLGELVKRAHDATRHRLQERDTQFVDRVPPRLPAVVGLRSPLERVLANLIENAAKYSEEGSEVAVVAEVIDENWVQLSVRDQGIGIAPEHHERIFERFYRVDRDRSRAAGGTGLGLSIVKHVVQRCGGRVWVESELGKGSAFCIRLRRADAPHPEPELVKSADHDREPVDVAEGEAEGAAEAGLPRVADERSASPGDIVVIPSPESDDK